MNIRSLLLPLLLLPATAAAQPPGLIPGDSYHLVFTTSSTHGITPNLFVPPFDFPNFGGVDAADWVVSNAASAAGLFGGWDGLSAVYKAVLSNDSENAIDRVGISAPVYNVVGDLIATGEADMFDGQLVNPIGFDENGVARTGVVWTGTNNSGNMTLNTCGDNFNNNSSGVTGTVGHTDSLLSPFSGSGTRACNTVARLFGVSPLLTVPAFDQAGDFDGDDDVDGFDFLAWQRSQLRPESLALWEANYGTPAPLVAAVSTPEPSSLLLASLAGCALLRVRRGTR